MITRLARRDLLTLLGIAATWPLAARAQSPMPTVGFLFSGSRQALEAAGYVESRNVAVAYRWAYDRFDRLPQLAIDLVREQPSVIVTNYPSILSVRAATQTIPTLFITGGDPMKQGLVTSLNRPGGNLTGISNLNSELMPKRIEILHEILPGKNSFAFLLNPANPNHEARTTELRSIAQSMGLQQHVLYARGVEEFDGAFAKLKALAAQALVISTDAFFINQGGRLGELAARHAIPAIFEYREFAAGGGLASYGGSTTEHWRLLATYVGRVLKGEKPADLPVQQSTKVELIINMKTANALGLTVPISLLGRADEVIE